MEISHLLRSGRNSDRGRNRPCGINLDQREPVTGSIRLKAMNSVAANFLVFGDLHGRVLPAFRLANRWSREHHVPIDGILQVGDLGYFPDLTRLDKATIRHAKLDLLELGLQDVIAPNELADGIFEDTHTPHALWFTAGNHEDFNELDRLAGGHANCKHFPVDYYCRINCVQDGSVTKLPGSLKVAAAWGIDGNQSTARTNLPKRGYIQERAIDRLLRVPFDLLLCHDAPYSAKQTGFGSRELALLVELAEPAFVFFGHYKGMGGPSPVHFGRTEVFHMGGFELRGQGNTAEPGSVGILHWEQGHGEFSYLDPNWLKTFSRHNWKYA
jgi:hypothetical protein